MKSKTENTSRDTNNF